MKPIRVEVRVKNNRLYRLIMLHNPSVKAFAVSIGAGLESMYKLMSFKLPAYVRELGPDLVLRRAVPTRLAQKVAAALDKPVEYIFPIELCSESHLGVGSRVLELEVKQLRSLALGSPAVRQLGWDDPAKAADDGSRSDVVEEALASLPERESLAVRMAFGIGMEGEESATVKEIGGRLRVTRSRADQIVSKAIRKLRHPSRAVRLGPYADAPLREL